MCIRDSYYVFSLSSGITFVVRWVICLAVAVVLSLLPLTEPRRGILTVRACSSVCLVFLLVRLFVSVLLYTWIHLSAAQVHRCHLYRRRRTLCRYRCDAVSQHAEFHRITWLHLLLLATLIFLYFFTSGNRWHDCPVLSAFLCVYHCFSKLK